MIRQFANQLKSSLGIGGKESPAEAECGFKDSKSALIVHGLHKSATMFLYKFFANLCSQVNVPIYSIHNQPADHQSPNDSTDHSFLLCPVRSFETESFSFPSLKSTRHLFQLRDPRDVLVSEYYSIGWRHSVDGWSQEDLDRRTLIQGLSVDEYVLREPEISKYPLLGRFEPLMKLESGSFDTVKYETMVTDFPRWLRTCLQAMEIDPTSPANSQFVASLEDRYRDEFRAGEDENAHKRNVTPGDHRNKLQPETVDKLNKRFAAELDAFDY